MTRAWLALAALLVPIAARAGEAEECASAYEKGQELRLEHRLVDARAQFLVCARPACPKAARDDCSRWLGEVDATLPGLVVRATSGGAPFDDARVFVDGKPVADRLDARAIPVDPGKHVVRVEPRGCAPHEKEVSLAAGAPAVVAFDVCGEAKPVAPAPHVARRPPVATFVLGGVALAAVASFAVFGALGVSDANALSSCYPHCEQGPVDAANAELAAADVSLGLAVALAAAAAIVWLVAPRHVPQQAFASPLAWTF